MKGKGILQTYFLKGKDSFVPEDSAHFDSAVSVTNVQEDGKPQQNGNCKKSADPSPNDADNQTVIESIQENGIGSNSDFKDGMPGVSVA